VGQAKKTKKKQEKTPYWAHRCDCRLAAAAEIIIDQKNGHFLYYHSNSSLKIAHKF